MKKQLQKTKAETSEVRSFGDFRKRFYPDSAKDACDEPCAPEEVGEKMAKESLHRLKAALTTL
jgi:hypothetical protein